MAMGVQSRPGPASAFASPELQSRLRLLLDRVIAALLLVAGLALIVALASYEPTDPSLNTSTREAARNLAMLPGALTADLLLQGFGLAGLLPAIAALAWAWRIGTHRGLGGVPLRLAALIAALPVLAALLAAVPIHTPWPAAGPGGAAGRLLGGLVVAASADLLGPYGGLALFALGALLAALLMLLALGLTARDYGAVRTAAQAGMAQSRGAAGLLSRLTRRTAEASIGLFHRIDGTANPAQSDKPADKAHPAAHPAALRAEPRLAVPGPTGTPASPGFPTIIAGPIRDSRATPTTPALPAAALRKPTEQIPLPLEQTWQFPSMDLLAPAPDRATLGGPTTEQLDATARLLETVLGEYGVDGRIVEHTAGPVVTLFELEPAPGIRAARVIGLADDVARSLSVLAVRIATVPGRNVIGIEVPNQIRDTVYFTELLHSQPWITSQATLPLALGQTIDGEAIIADLARMPHLLVAGTTGSGKSVGINAMILSLLYKHAPDDCRIIMIDPKMLELSIYEGIPHLLAPVVTEPAKAVTALKWACGEMDRRYRSMSQLGVRNIAGYNDRVAEARARGEVVIRRVQTGFDSETGKPVFEELPLALEKLPLVVIVIDEMADLMMVAGKEIEIAVQRLAQKARAAGIHVIMATQRPSVDVITGTIKANFPTRISFTVISKFDSRTILGEQGAEQLLGQGDMLYMMLGGRIRRVHGPFVADKEVEAVVAHLRAQGEPDYVDEVTEASDDDNGPSPSGAALDSEMSLFDQAVDLVSREGKASTSFLQRHLNIGYNRAAKLIEQMEKDGIVTAANHVGKREVLARHTNHDID